MPLILAAILLLATLASHASVEIYESGKRTFSCTRVEEEVVTAPPPVEAPVDVEFGTFVWSPQWEGDKEPVNPQPLYDQALLPPGPMVIEVLVGKVHHVIWKSGNTVLRRENIYPYSHTQTLTAGASYHFVADVYSTETALLGTFSVLVYVSGSVDADADAASKEPAARLVTFEWTRPVERVDGTPLAVEEIARYHLTVAGSTLPVPGEVESYSMSLTPGEYVVTLVAEDIGGLLSDPSEPLFFRL